MCDEGGDAVAERKGEFHGTLDDVDVILHYRDGALLLDSDNPVQIQRLLSIGYLKVLQYTGGRPFLKATRMGMMRTRVMRRLSPEDERWLEDEVRYLKYGLR